MGKIRPTYIKRAAKRLLERYPDKFSTSYAQNRKVLGEVAIIESPSLRNRIAGYLVTLLKQKEEEV